LVASAGRVVPAVVTAAGVESVAGTAVATMWPEELVVVPGRQPRAATNATTRSRRFMMGGYPGTGERCKPIGECNPDAGPVSPLAA
jgi:hypothetical protein